ncbi:MULTISPECIES: phosphocholine-specific phospholipase C [unclassified Nocardia]|uniref:phosphocholine-specific phospholipase C n=1 Tax=unclassified Nocardia TaxID=2637762 RepID=UPI001CE47614|nr:MULTISPECIES: phospholipase C, phosphocholine-specific [unclassified Nocardia]
MAYRFGRIKRRTALGGLFAAAGVAGLGLRAQRAGAAPRRGSLDDVRHVVILMQENRSFDHYYGTMAGARGFGDRTALRLLPGGADPASQAVAEGVAAASNGRQPGTGVSGLPTGSSGSVRGDVFAQPDALGAGYLLPFHLDTTRFDAQDAGDLPHDWNTTHQAWADGAYHSWIAAKSEMTMGYFTEADIPFHRALAQAFTLCDNYFCSIQGPTTPNRLYHWTGTIDPGGTLGGPATFNPADYKPVYRWTTYPERLQQAGISWQVFANDRAGDTDAIFLGDYGDNPLWLFQAYHDALASTDPAVRQLAERANVTGTWKPADGADGKNVDYVLEQFISACATNTLPQVSWVVAPMGYTEHPAARPVDGAVYVQRVLKALWDNPKLWESTVVLINYDENDGLFDHLVPPTPPPGTPDEFLPANQPGGGTELPQLAASGVTELVGKTGSAEFRPAWGRPTPIGLGPRVPLLVISPWSRGGWVNSQVFDHTSVLRFLEAWTGVREPNISDWRRAVCGDLTSCFDFRTTDTTIPLLPDTAALRAEADRTQPSLPKPVPPAPDDQEMPVPDPGTAKARPLPYQPVAWADTTATPLSLMLANQGAAALQFQCYAYHPGADAPVRQVLATAGGTATARIPFTDAYDVAVHGPNGFLFEAAGDNSAADLTVSAVVGGTASNPNFTVTMRNSGQKPIDITIAGVGVTVAPGEAADHTVADTDGWYDVTLTLPARPNWRRRFTGHLENGRPSRTG